MANTLNIQDWLLFSVICIVLWGLWGFLIKLTYKDLSWTQTYFLTSLSSFILAFTVYLYYRSPIPITSKATLIALIAGLMGGAGYVFFMKALEKGKASIVIPLTAIYPAVTVILSLLILHEKPSIYQVIGIILALIAIVLVSIK